MLIVGYGAKPSKGAPVAPTPAPREDVGAEDVEFEEVDFELSLQDMRRELQEMKRREGRVLNSASTNRKLRSDIQRLKGIIDERERREQEESPLARFI
jgi:hypothetical protein